MPRRVFKPKRLHEILVAARKVIAQDGFQGANLESIAREAGVSKGALYLYFPNKENLFLRALEDGFDNMVADVTRAMEGARGVKARLTALVRSQFSFMEKHQDFLKAFILERRGLSCPPGDEDFLRLRQKGIAYTERVADVIRLGIEQGVFRRVDAIKSAFYLVELVKAMVVGRIIGLPVAPWEQECSLVEEIFFNGILVQEHDRDEPTTGPFLG